MKNSNKKIIIISLFITIIIIVILISSINKLESKKEHNNKIISNSEIEADIEDEMTQEQFYNIVNIIKKYNTIINIDNYEYKDGESYADNYNVKKGIYSILNKNYIIKNNIKIENVYNYVKTISGINTFVPLKMKFKVGENINQYIVLGNLIDLNTNAYEKVFYLVDIDKKNRTFTVEQILNKYKDINEIEFNSTVNLIEHNQYNEYEHIKYDEEMIAKQKFADFKNLLLTKNEFAFNMFDEEYRRKKFEDYEDFKSYIDKNNKAFNIITLEKYQVLNNKYICIDTNGKYYIFSNNEYDMSLKVLMDTYTIDLPQFKAKYNKASEEEKVGYNIEKFFESINDKDYKYAYAKLDDNFKKNKISTLEKFEEFSNKVFFENNKVIYDNADKKGNNFIYDITLKSSNKKNDKIIKMTIIMQLKEDYDYVVSFSFR